MTSEQRVRGLVLFRENPSFRALWASRVTSSIGDALIPVAVAFAVFEIGGDAVDLGLVLGVGTGLQVVLLPLAGVLADRLPRRALMLAGDVIRGMAQATCAALLLMDRASVASLLSCYVAMAVGDAVFNPAASGILPQTVRRRDLKSANALMSVGQSAARVFGPAMAGLLIATTSAGWAFAIDAVSYVVSALALLAIKVETTTRDRESVVEELKLGWREVLARPWYWHNLIGHGCWNVAIAVFFVLGPTETERSGQGSVGWGLVAGCLAAGTVVGGLVAVKVHTSRPIAVGNLALTTGALPLAALAVDAPLGVLAATAFIAMAGTAVLNVLWLTTLQSTLPENVISRVLSYDWLISLVAMPIGFAAAGPAAQQYGTPATAAAAALLIVVSCVPLALAPSARLDLVGSDRERSELGR